MRTLLLVALIATTALTIVASPAEARPPPCEVYSDGHNFAVACNGEPLFRGCVWVTTGDGVFYCY